MATRDPFARRLVKPKQVSVRYATHQRIAREAARLRQTPGVTLDGIVAAFLDQQGAK